MPCALQDTQVSTPRTDEVTVRMCHNAGQLMQVSQIVNGPRREKLRHMSGHVPHPAPGIA